MGLRLQDPDLKVANVLVFEDAPSGVAAAHAAGM
jgi:beta-phosphoglucomutase-like phosphatase (HAD superfamily)